MFLSAGCSRLRAEGFLCSLEILYGGLGSRDKYIVYIPKKFNFFSSKFYQIFSYQNPGSELDPVTDRYSAQNAGSGSV